MERRARQVASWDLSSRVGRHSGKWRLISDLSFRRGYSVNDGIAPALCTLHYTSVDKVAKEAQGAGTCARSAYRLAPVHPDDRTLLGVEWQGSHYVDGMLPFGLCSAPKVFTAVADALEWCIRERGVTGIDHYLDDFITVAPPGSNMC